ncbi:hypothetical protein, partial [Haloferula sp. A504]|uniref:hypothetical protein n=1 Tax=Haloferula sp. A504 TaxID=3373601 RepID=UPI0031C3C059|nr:hypothetical protein [Verrucomicrobiaceae bacterium E54]
MRTKILATVSVAALAALSTHANAAVGFIYHDSATTTGGEFSATNYPIENLKDAGHTSHLDTESAADFNVSYATANGPTDGYPVTITLDFASAVNLTDFYLWNHSNNNGAG